MVGTMIELPRAWVTAKIAGEADSSPSAPMIYPRPHMAFPGMIQAEFAPLYSRNTHTSRQSLFTIDVQQSAFFFFFGGGGACCSRLSFIAVRGPLGTIRRNLGPIQNTGVNHHASSLGSQRGNFSTEPRQERSPWMPAKDSSRSSYRKLGSFERKRFPQRASTKREVSTRLRETVLLQELSPSSSRRLSSPTTATLKDFCAISGTSFS